MLVLPGTQSDSSLGGGALLLCWRVIGLVVVSLDSWISLSPPREAQGLRLSSGQHCSGRRGARTATGPMELVWKWGAVP